jgi:hypothetical protein
MVGIWSGGHDGHVIRKAWWAYGQEGMVGMWACGDAIICSRGHLQYAHAVMRYVVTWSYAHVVMLACGHVIILMWSCAQMVMWSCGLVATWSCGHVWSCGLVATWSCGHDVMIMLLPACPLFRHNRASLFSSYAHTPGRKQYCCW